MSIPDYQKLMLPLLLIAQDNKKHKLQDAIKELSENFNLTDEEKKELLPSGKQYKFNNRVNWARTYLRKAGLLDCPERGFFKITDRGIQFLSKKPDQITTKSLWQFPEFQTFQGRRKTRTNYENIENEENTPEEKIESSILEINESLAFELLGKIEESSNSFFEKIVVELLLKMGYGGSRKDAGKAIGKSGDGGIDGIINEDKLGLDKIYIQAKKWGDTHVGRPELQKFAGSLEMHHATKGVFITTSKFTADARDYVKKIQKTIILIDGEELAHLMIEYNLGVSSVALYELKKIDNDYFIDD